MQREWHSYWADTQHQASGIKMNSLITAVLSCLAFQMNNKIELCATFHN